MNKKQLLLSILILFLIVYLINAGYLASATQPKIETDYSEYLKTYTQSFSMKGDLNNDGEEEEISIFRQWDGEGWYSDDSWYVLRILDKSKNIVYGKEISYFQVVEGLSIKDVNGDGLKEIIVSLNPTKYWTSKTYTYGWKGNAYELISEKN